MLNFCHFYLSGQYLNWICWFFECLLSRSLACLPLKKMVGSYFIIFFFRRHSGHCIGTGTAPDVFQWIKKKEKLNRTNITTTDEICLRLCKYISNIKLKLLLQFSICTHPSNWKLQMIRTKNSNASNAFKANFKRWIKENLMSEIFYYYYHFQLN